MSKSRDYLLLTMQGIFLRRKYFCVNKSVTTNKEKRVLDHVKDRGTTTRHS